MVIAYSIFCIVCILFLIWSLREWSKSAKKAKTANEAYDVAVKKLLELTTKQEDVDIWKKACWDAEARNLDTSARLCETDELLRKTQAEVEKVFNQKKSSEVRTGLIAEQMAPFISGFPYNPKDAHFLGKPIDFIVFSEDAVHFVEVKSGEAKLTDVQRRIKKNIEEKRISFEIFRINGE